LSFYLTVTYCLVPVPISLDYPVCAVQHRLRNRHADFRCGFKIDYKLKFRWLLDREIGGLGALQDLVDMVEGLLQVFDLAGP
jgi:hypothetical protein